LSTGVHLATYSGMVAAASLASVLQGEVSEEQALAFYDQSYRHSYLRLMLVVSGMYQQYNGKDSYFWQAQQLTNNEYTANPDMQLAFLQVVSGMEDLKDSEDAPLQEDSPVLLQSAEQDSVALMDQHAQTLLTAEEGERKMAIFQL